MAEAAMQTAPSDGLAPMVQAELMTGQTGVRITGTPIVDMTDAEIEDVRGLIANYCVAVFPDQYLSPEEQVRFLGRFDPVTFTPGEDRHPVWRDVHVIARPGVPQPPINGFHTDTSFVEQPPSFTSLSAIELPDHGGDTVFANQYLAYDSLSSVMKRWLAGLRFKHVVSGTKRPEEVPDPVWHPAVRTNPVTGRKALYVTLLARCSEAEGMTARGGQESDHVPLRAFAERLHPIPAPLATGRVSDLGQPLHVAHGRLRPRRPTTHPVPGDVRRRTSVRVATLSALTQRLRPVRQCERSASADAGVCYCSEVT